MAYNPFNIFRRNQKAIFAVVTVVIMFMFVLSSGMTGKADFFNWLPDWIRGKTKKGDSYCEIDGTRIYPRDVEALRFQRVVANKFMQRAAFDTVGNMQKSLVDLAKQGSPEYAFFYQNLLSSLSQGDLNQFAQMSSFLVRMKSDEKSKDKLKPTDLKAIEVVEVMSNLLQSRGQITPIPFTSDRDMIEFMLWQKKAKQLGIQFNEDDVKSLLNKEFMGSLGNADIAARQALSAEYKERYSDGMLIKALAAEFEVRAAYSAIVGYNMRGDHTLNSLMISAPPYELFEFYRDKTSPTAYQMLRVPVEAFIPLVSGEPTEDEIQRLFRDRQEYEPDPSKEEPGFKEPRKIKVEWVSVTGDEPYYKKAAADWLTRTELLAKSEVRGLIVPFPGTGMAAVFHIAAPAALKEPLVQEKYKDIEKGHQGRVGFGWSGITSIVNTSDILETSMVQPQNLVAVAGAVPGSMGFGNALVPATLFHSANVAAEHKARIKAGIPLFLVVPGPAMLQTMIGGEAVFRKNLPAALTLATYKPELLKGLSESKARELAVNDLKNLKKSIDELKETGKARESAARDLVAEFVKTRGVKTGASTEFASEFTIGDDPGLAPLKSVLDKEKDKDPHSMMGALGGPVRFGSAFFWKSDRFGRSKDPAVGTFLPEFYPERAADNALSPFAKPDPVFLARRTAEKNAAKVLVTEARPKVIEAWKRVKARELAKAEAERFASELRNKPGESEFLIGLNMSDMAFQLQTKTPSAKAKELIKSFRVDNVAPLAITKDFSGMGMGGAGGETLTGFGLMPSADIPYPTPEMGKQLLDERTKPVRTTFVQIDQPKDSYYVVVLLDRRERSAEEFRAHVYGTLQRSQVGGQIAGAQGRLSITRTRDTILALLKKEFKYVESEEQKKKLDDRQKNSVDD